MNLRRLATAAVALMTCITVFATGQECDIITINGTEWGLLARPVCFDGTLRKAVMAALPADRGINTANWEGFTSHWTVRSDSLFLDKITYEVYNSNADGYTIREVNAATLDSIFAPYKTPGGIHAAWVSGELRAGRGSLVRYVHSGFDRNVGTEYVMQVASGIVTDSRVYHNSITPGTPLDSASVEVSRRFPWKQFPELAGKRLVFNVSNCTVTPDGRLTDLEAKLMRMGNDNVYKADGPVVEAFKDAMRAIFPWKTLHINGKDMMEHESYTFPVKEGKGDGDKP